MLSGKTWIHFLLRMFNVTYFWSIPGALSADIPSFRLWDGTLPFETGLREIRYRGLCVCKTTNGSERSSHQWQILQLGGSAEEPMAVICQSANRNKFLLVVAASWFDGR